MLSSLFSQMPSAPAAPTGAASTSKSGAGEQVAGDLSSSDSEGSGFLQSLQSILGESAPQQAKDVKSTAQLPSASEHDAVTGDVSDDSERVEGEGIDGTPDESTLVSGSLAGAESEFAVEGTSASDLESTDEAHTPSDASQVSDGLNVPSSSAGATKAAGSESKAENSSVGQTTNDSDSTDDAEQAVADVFAFLQHLSASSRQLADGESTTKSDVVDEITPVDASPSEFSMLAKWQITGKDLPDDLSVFAAQAVVESGSDVSADNQADIDSPASTDGDALTELSRLLSGNFGSDKVVGDDQGGDDSVIGKEAVAGKDTMIAKDAVIGKEVAIGKEASTEKELAAKVAASQQADGKVADSKGTAQPALDSAAKPDSTVSAELDRVLSRHKPVASGSEASAMTDPAASPLATDEMSLLTGAATSRGELSAADVAPGKGEAAIAAQHVATASVAGMNRMPTEPGPVANQQPPLQLSESKGHDELAERVQVMVSKNLKHVDIRLDPPELGKLQIKLSVNNDQASVQFTVANSQARELVEHAMPRLREMLAQQGLQLAQGSVQQDDGRQSGSQFQQQAQQQQAQQGNAGHSGGRNHATNSGQNTGDGSHTAAEPASMWVSQPDDGVDYYA